MTTKSSGFTLIELLVVVAILGIIAAIGITSYSGYVSSTKKKSTENIMRAAKLSDISAHIDRLSAKTFVYDSNSMVMIKNFLKESFEANASTITE